MLESTNTNNKTPWWIIQTKPQAEFTAMQHLKNQGFTLYCPMFKKERFRGRKLKVNTYPLFPSYLFVEANYGAQKNIHAIRSTLGVSRF